MEHSVASEVRRLEPQEIAGSRADYDGLLELRSATATGPCD